jgi:hypothetical protein
MSLRWDNPLLEGLGGYSKHGFRPTDVFQSFLDLAKNPSRNVWLVVEVVHGNREFSISGSPLKISNYLMQITKDNPDSEIRYRVVDFTSDRNEARRKAQEV